MTYSQYTEEQIKKSVENSRASLEIEGLKVPKEYEDLVLKKLSNQISQAEFLEQIKNLIIKSKFDKQ